MGQKTSARRSSCALRLLGAKGIFHFSFGSIIAHLVLIVTATSKRKRIVDIPGFTARSMYRSEWQVGKAYRSANDTKKNVNKSKTIKTKRNFDWQHGQRSSSIGGANGSQSGTHTIQAHTVHPREEKPENFECGTSQFLNQTKPNNQHAYRFNMLTSVFFSIFFFRLVSFHFVWLLMLWIMY